jgi:type IV pilus assembly protein PilY1
VKREHGVNEGMTMDARKWMAVLACCCACLPAPAIADATDLATSPVATTSLVKPNLMFILDNSGSMEDTTMPDWADDATSLALQKNSRYNSVFYDPAVRYLVPPRGDGSYYLSMTAANTSTWTRVPLDAYGQLSTAVSDLKVNPPAYFTFTAGEYCDSPALISCITQSAATAAYPYPAYVRWCTDLTLTKCQAVYAAGPLGNGLRYTVGRTPGVTASVPGSNAYTTVTSSKPTYTKASTRPDCAAAYCTYEEEMTNHANWHAYYRTRIQMAKTAILLAFADLDDSVRVGYMTINDVADRTDFLNVADFDAATKQTLYATIAVAKTSPSTPLRTALATTGRYFAGKLTRVSGENARDPMQYACQRNYAILQTDGYWNDSVNPKQVDGSTDVGNQDGGLPSPYWDANNTSNTLADVAQYYYDTDLRSAALGNAVNSQGADVSSNAYANKRQNLVTYTIGMGASGYMQFQSNYASAVSGDYHDIVNGTQASAVNQARGICRWQTSGTCTWPTPVSNTQTAIDDLWHAAVNGRGGYYSATNVSEFKDGLSTALQSIVSSGSSGAAPTSGNVNLSAAGSNYVFSTGFCSSKWFGELARYTVNATTGARAATPDWSQSGAGNDCIESSGTGLRTTPLLDRLSASARNIYTWKAASGSGMRIPFEWASLGSAQQGHFQMAAIGGLSQMCSVGSACLASSAQVDSASAGAVGAGGANLVAYLRGERGNEGVNNTAYYFPRTHVLGDTVDAQPMHVGPPSQSYADTGYAAYKSSQASRQAMVYLGANDGMLHAFRADTGAESWAYIPSLLLPRLYLLADKKYATRHRFFVNGATTAADIHDGSAWRTILVGGLGAGGRGFYALDVSDPASPQVLWEFTHDSSLDTAYVRDADLGYSYGAPIVTKLSDGTWVVLLSSGYNNISPGSGRGVMWVLNAKTGAVIQKLDTGIGSTAGGSVPAGCTAAPCPSGLARLSAWSDSASNNVATYVYGGDLLGNLWRFDLRTLTRSGGTASVQLIATLADAAGVRQPITTRPELGLVGGTRVVYVGTGSYLGLTDVSSTQTQTLYALKDPLTTVTGSSGLYGSPRASACTTSKVTQCFMPRTLSDSGGVRSVSSPLAYALSFDSMNGWYEDLPNAGERIDTNPTLQLGTLVYVSNLPTREAGCKTGGSSYLNYVDYATGLAISAGAGTEAGVLLNGEAVSSTTTLAITTTGQVVASINSSDGSSSVKNVPTVGPDRGTRRLTWRELAIGQ